MNCILILLLSTSAASATEPGGVGRITSHGLNYAISEISKQLMWLIKTSNIDDIHVDHLDATGLKITDISPIVFAYDLQPPAGVALTGSEANIELHGHFHAYTKILGIKVSKSGSFTAKASQSKVKVSARIGKDTQGHPKVGMLSCGVDIGSLRIKLDAGAVGWVVNLFHSALEGKLKPVIENALCSALDGYVKGDLKRTLATLPLLVDLNGPFKLDYRLVQTPSVTQEFIEAGVSGQISYNGKGGTPFKPSDPVLGTSQYRMLYLYMTDYVLNSGLYAETKYGYLKYELSAKTEPDAAKYLRTTCSIIHPCVGTIFPDLAQKYPNTTVVLDIYPTNGTYPNVTFDTPGASVYGTAELPLRVINRTSGKLSGVVKTMNLTAEALLDPKITGSKVTGKVEIKKLVIPGVLPFLETLLKTVLETAINTYLQKGIPLPVVEGYTLAGSDITFGKRTIQIGADVARKSQEIIPGY